MADTRGRFGYMKRALPNFIEVGRRMSEALGAGRAEKAGHIATDFAPYRGLFGEDLTAVRDELAALTVAAAGEVYRLNRGLIILELVMLGLASLVGLGLSLIAGTEKSQRHMRVTGEFVWNVHQDVTVRIAGIGVENEIKLHTVLVANDGDIVPHVRQGEPEHPVKGEGAIEFTHADADMIDLLDCDGLGHWELRPLWIPGILYRKKSGCPVRRFQALSAPWVVDTDELSSTNSTTKRFVRITG
jgi:hypothetical protein